MSHLQRITQKEIARKAGVTQAAVSLALSHHSRIPVETQARILAFAEKLGYKPDPYLSGLSAYRRRVRPARFQATLAWLSNYPPNSSWKEHPTFCGYHQGAVARAQELGYRLEEHILSAKGMSSQGMERILTARNIPGILLVPQPKAYMEIDFCFDKFSAVTFGFTLEKPQLHLVTMQQFRSMETAFRRLLDLGYRRPGLAMNLESDKRADRNWSAAFWSEQRKLPTKNRLPLLLEQPLERAVFLKWFRKYRPDVVLSIGEDTYRWLKSDGVSIPKETGFALLTVPDGGSFYSGIWENPQVIGAKAVEFLIDLIHRNERGCPQIPLSLLVSGTWVGGKTVRII